MVLSEPRVVWILSVKCRAWPWVICQQCGIVSHMRSKIIFNIISTTRDQTNKNRENLLDGYRWLEMIADVFISNFCSRLTSQLVKINIALHSIIVSTDKSEKLKWWIGTWIISWFLQNFNFFFLYRIVKLFNLTPRKRLLLYSYCKIWIDTVILPTQQIQNLHFNNTWSISNLTRWYSFFWRRKNYVVLYIDVHRIIQFMIDFQVQRVKLHP